MLTFNVSRRQVWIVALMVLIGAIWLVRDDQAGAGIIPPGEGIDVVYLAVATNFPDSLGVGPGAGVNAGPILLVPTNPPIPGFTQAELVRLDPQKVVIVGGTAVISLAMQTAVEALLPNATVERLAGSNRYETNTLFTQSVYPVESWASIHASAFVPDLGGNILYSIATVYSDSDMWAPIQLPHGATILELRLRGVDDDGAEDHYVTLGRQCGADLPDGILTVMTSGDPGFFDMSSTSYDEPGVEVVDNEACIYLVGAFDTDSDNTVIGIRVKYRLGTPGA